MNTTSNNAGTTATTDRPHRTSTRTRIIAAALIFAGITGGSLALAGSAGATTTLNPHALAAAAAPVTVINAVQDQQGAAAAMKLFDDATTTNKSFATTTDPSYNTTGWAVAPGGLEEENNAGVGGDPEAVTYRVTNAVDSSWSLGGSVGVSAGGGIGFAQASVSLKLSASHTWGTTTGDAIEIDASVDPQKMVWVLQSQTIATYTGTYSFTANGTNYQVTNVTITTPVNNSKDPNPLTATNYRIVQAPISQVAHQLGQTPTALHAHQLTAAQLNELSTKLGLNK